MRFVRPAATGMLAACAVLAGSTVPVVGSAAATAGASGLSSQLAAGLARAGALRSAIGAENHRLALVQGQVSAVQARLNAVEADLAAKQATLAATQAALRRERARLAALERQLVLADRALSANLRSQFESDPPDVFTVVLRSHGFADLLEKLQFVSAAKNHDQQLITADRKVRGIVIAQAVRLGALSQREQALAAVVLSRRNDIDRIRLALVDRAIRIENARSVKTAALGRAEAQRNHLVAEIARLQAAAQPPPASSSAGGGPPPVVGNLLRGGGIVFPLPGGAGVGPGSWSDDQGVDISAPGHTPLLAIGSGTIVLHGIGGFGPDAPVLRLDDGRYVYYGHAGPGNAVPIGTHVGAGAVISEVGAGIVGISTGPHLEIGFADANGTPLGSSTAGTMHSLLLGAYH